MSNIPQTMDNIDHNHCVMLLLCIKKFINYHSSLNKNNLKPNGHSVLKMDIATEYERMVASHQSTRHKLKNIAIISTTVYSTFILFCPDWRLCCPSANSLANSNSDLFHNSSTSATRTALFTSFSCSDVASLRN